MATVRYEIEGSKPESEISIARARLRIDDSNALNVEFQAPNGDWFCVVWFGKDGRLYRTGSAQSIPGLTTMTDQDSRIKCV